MSRRGSEVWQFDGDPAPLAGDNILEFSFHTDLNFYHIGTLYSFAGYLKLSLIHCNITMACWNLTLHWSITRSWDFKHEGDFVSPEADPVPQSFFFCFQCYPVQILSNRIEQKLSSVSRLAESPRPYVCTFDCFYSSVYSHFIGSLQSILIASCSTSLQSCVFTFRKASNQINISGKVTRGEAVPAESHHKGLII